MAEPIGNSEKAITNAVALVEAMAAASVPPPPPPQLANAIANLRLAMRGGP